MKMVEFELEGSPLFVNPEHIVAIRQYGPDEAHLILVTKDEFRFSGVTVQQLRNIAEGRRRDQNHEPLFS